jgi:dihydropteroate synthase
MEPRVIALHCENIKDVITEAIRLGTAMDAPDEVVSHALFRGLRVENLPLVEARFMRDEMAAAGGAAMLPERQGDPCNVLLFGTFIQFRRLVSHLSGAGDIARAAAERIRNVLLAIEGSAPPHPVDAGRAILEFGERTLVMGILNTTPDSFYDGGRHEGTPAAVRHGMRLIAEGADILDVGGESTRPGSEPVPTEEEIKRIVPVIAALRAKNDKIPISVDTKKADVARAALDAGADIVNDVSALRADPDMALVCAERGAPVCLMHMQGTPADMQHDPRYASDVVFEICAFLEERIHTAVSSGIALEKILLDPGIGFGKTLDHNLEILRRLPELRSLGRPVIAGASRKRFIGELTKQLPEKRIEGSLAAAVVAAGGGAQIVRVHDVAATRKALAVADAVIRHPRMVTKDGS